MYVATRMRQAWLVSRRIGTIASVSWLAGAASILPFASGWFDLGERAANLLLLAALASAFGLSLLIHYSPRARSLVRRLAGPDENPAHALVLVGVLACAGLGAMLAASALVSST